MKFEQAFSTIREYGGRMKRASYPEVDYYIDREKNILMSYDNYNDLEEYDRLDEARLWGTDMMGEDWEVDTEGRWED